MATRGLFSVHSSSVEEAFETLVGVCGELGAKLSNIDTLEYQIDGKSKNTWKAWGVKFRAWVIKDSSGIKIEVFDLARLSTDMFIKELYNKFTKYISASPLTVDLFTQDRDVSREDDLRFSGYEREARIEETGDPLPGRGAPEMVADIPDDNDKVLPATGELCDQCGASITTGSRLCDKCGHRLIICPSCGYAPEDDSSFCIKCGTKLV